MVMVVSQLPRAAPCARKSSPCVLKMARNRRFMARWANFFAVGHEVARCWANFFAEMPVEAPCWASFLAGEADGTLCWAKFFAVGHEVARCWAKFFAGQQSRGPLDACVAPRWRLRPAPRSRACHRH